jgi:hypothetical protein
MGNFSRTTFDPAKNYVAVRLEQGVPLVDADWNELQDTTRTEVYEAFRTALPNAAARDGGLAVTVAGANDLFVSPGRGVADGHPFRLWAQLQYSTQRYANAATAAADGVAQAAPLTPPFLFVRTDCVYIDTFEREVGSGEDPNLINGAIGLETATRLKREVVLRVAQGSTVPPAPPPGHGYVAIALLNRTPGPLVASQIQDARTYPLPVGVREQSFAPLLFTATLAGTTYGGFQFETGFPPYRVLARKPAVQSDAFGAMQLPVPDQARLVQVRLRGTSSALVSWRVDRGHHDGTPSVQVVNDSAFTGVPFDRLVPIAGEPPIDNSTTYYLLTVRVSGLALADIYGGSIRYVP